MKQTKTVKQVRAGRFQITHWQVEHSNGDATMERIYLRYGTYDKDIGKWNNQQIWFSPDELRDLVQALDRWDDEEEQDQEGKHPPSPISPSSISSEVQDDFRPHCAGGRKSSPKRNKRGDTP